MNLRTPFCEVGGFIFVIDSAFLLGGRMTSCVIQKPKYSISVWAKKVFSMLYLSLIYFILVKESYKILK